MSNYSGHSPATELDRVREEMTRQGYALTSDQAIGLTEVPRASLLEKYFNNSVLRHDDGDQPVDRERARDVVKYEWRNSRLHLQEHDTITITDRGGIPGKRDHTRVWLLNDRNGERIVRAFLTLVPPDRRQKEGTFGVNLFRAHSKVVEGLHRDYEQFIMLYVLDRKGGGGENYLYRSGDVIDGTPAAGPIFKHRLNPGEILIFEDELFRHGAGPLVPPPGGMAHRDVLVCTVDHRSTYLGDA